jgi:hypothetical protein
MMNDGDIVNLQRVQGKKRRRLPQASNEIITLL